MQGSVRNVIVSWLARLLHVEKRWAFIHANVSNTEAYPLLDNCQFDVVVAIHGCGTLTDFAITFALEHRANLIYVPCCWHKLTDVAYESVLGRFLTWRVVDGMRIQRLTSRGYNLRVRVLRCDMITHKRGSMKASPIYLANIPRRPNHRHTRNAAQLYDAYETESFVNREKFARIRYRNVYGAFKK